METNEGPWTVPSLGVGALVGAAVVLGFTVLHDILISDIWFNAGPMLFTGALIGLLVTWSYRTAVERHSTLSWFRYAGLYTLEMIVLGGVSIAVLRPRFTMAELMVADDAMERLLPPSLPLLIAATVVGTFLIWLLNERRRQALVPILVTQVITVFFLGHQFAFLGLVESSSHLMVVFGEFALYTVGLTASFCVGVMWSTRAYERLLGNRSGTETLS
jgi:hypothetical protein